MSRPEHVFSIRRMVSFAETDMAGVMHFSNYFRLMEEVEHAFWRSINESVVRIEHDQTISWPRVSTHCDFSSPARFEDEIRLELRVARLGQKSITFEVDFYRDLEQLARGRMTAVCCHMQHGRFDTTEIPGALRAKLEPYALADD